MSSAADRGCFESLAQRVDAAMDVGKDAESGTLAVRERFRCNVWRKIVCAPPQNQSASANVLPFMQVATWGPKQALRRQASQRFVGGLGEPAWKRWCFRCAARCGAVTVRAHDGN